MNRAIVIMRGNVTLGRTYAETGETTLASFDYDADGVAVAIGHLNPDAEINVTDTLVFGDYDAAGYLSTALEKMSPSREINIPDFKKILVAAMQNHDSEYFCEYCEKYGNYCNDCIVGAWKRQLEGEL